MRDEIWLCRKKEKKGQEKLGTNALCNSSWTSKQSNKARLSWWWKNYNVDEKHLRVMTWTTSAPFSLSLLFFSKRTWLFSWPFLSVLDVLWSMKFEPLLWWWYVNFLMWQIMITQRQKGNIIWYMFWLLPPTQASGQTAGTTADFLSARRLKNMQRIWKFLGLLNHSFLGIREEIRYK